MRRSNAAVFVLLLGICAFASAQTTAPAPSPDALVAQLHADDWRTRENAQHALVDLGEASFPALRAATQPAADEESRWRAAAALQQLEDIFAVRPPPITLHMHNAAPADVLAELSRQIGVSLEPQFKTFWEQRRLKPISIDFDGVGFWRVWQSISAQTGIGLQEWKREIHVNDQGSILEMYRPLIVGPYRVLAHELRRTQSVNLGTTAARSDEMDLFLELQCDPRVHLKQVGNAVVITEAVDDHGNSLVHPPIDNTQNFTREDKLFYNCNANLMFAKRNPGTQVSRLSGYFVASVVTDLSDLVFSDLANAHHVAQSTGDGFLTLQRFHRRGQQYVADLELTVPQTPDSNHEDVRNAASRLLKDLILVDANGVRYHRPPAAYGGNGSQPVRMGIAFDVGDDPLHQPGPPDRLIYPGMANSREIHIPFEFYDLPLP